MPEKMKKPSAVWSVTMCRIGFVTHFLSLLGKYKQFLILSKYKNILILSKYKQILILSKYKHILILSK